MKHVRFDNNRAVICGTIRGEFSFSHSMYGENFYDATIETERASGTSDLIPIVVSERLTDVKEVWSGRKALITGNFRSYNMCYEGKIHLVLKMFVREFVECGVNETCENRISIDGYICKSVVYRKTPFGREISDVLLAVNRAYGKTDYIPCICWGRNARFSNGLDVGSHIFISGRIQSREYEKKISDEEYIQQTAYEVSANELEVINDVDKKKN